MTSSKTWTVDLDGASAGGMLTAMTPVEGSADYVAIEQFVGRLHDRRGAFVLTHHGRMRGEDSELSLSVVPDSGTEQLTGITGTTTIGPAAEGHPWKFTYDLPRGAEGA